MYKTYSESQRLLTSHCDMHSAWRPGAVLELMQEAAGDHSERMGMGRLKLLDQGIVWVLTRLEVEMDRYPLVGETVTVETFHTPLRRWFFPRYFLIRDGQDREIGRAGSLWVLMDIHTRHMIQPGAVAALLPDNSDLPAPLGLPGPVTEVGGTLESDQRQPVYTDLDANGHVNNARYVDWCCNALGIEAMDRCELAHFTVNYGMETRPGQQVRTELRRLGDAFSYSGFVGDERHFDVGGVLRPRTADR